MILKTLESMKRYQKIKNKKVKCSSFALMIVNVLLVGCSTNVAEASTVHDYGENIHGLKNAYAQGNLHILQIGDSHTAGDYFTEQLRKRLQQDLGDGGLGFAYSSKLKGQRNARHDYQSSWTTHNSRFDQSGGEYPLGGVYASPSSRDSRLSLTSQYYNGDTQDARIVVYGQSGQTITLKNKSGVRDLVLNHSGWQTLYSPVDFPTSFQADSNIKIGGFWLSRAKGGVVSAMGINGATQDYWNRWNTDLAQGLAFSQADLVILAYGTNEAFRSNASDLVYNMNNAIKQVRQGLPTASILVIGAPESLSNKNGSCGKRSPSLNSVQDQLQQVAKQNHTLYWSWQDAMGGVCSMKSWVNQGLAASDGVHFSRNGYSYVANDLYDNLKSIMSNGNSYDDNGSTDVQITRKYLADNTTEISNTPKKSNSGKGKICNADGSCISF